MEVVHERLPQDDFALVPRILELRPRFVVDVGCGFNEFKGLGPNLIGVGLVKPAADFVCDFQDAAIKPASIGVILAVGSINFGHPELIAEQYRRLINDGFVRPLNPAGISH